MRKAALALCAAACSAPARPVTGPPAPKGTDFHATVVWTSYGVPHVTAADWGSLGFGQGWALASLHLCVVEDAVVRVRSERARFFGPGDHGANLDSDFFHLHMGFAGRAKDAIAHASPEARALAHGFVAGFDRWLATHGDAVPAACKGAAWVRPVTDEDLGAMALALATTASSRALEGLIANAAPRSGKAARASLPPVGETLASNGWAVGGDRTASGGGLLLANPHFPWEGDLQFYESQLTIPGQLDVYGAAVVGTPGIQLGFNAHVAWTHTFSSSTHFVIYRVPLVSGQPLRIAVGDTPEPIVPATYTIQSKKADGTLESVSRTLYRTRWGPMIDSDELPWDPTAGTAFALRDVALDEGTAMDEYLAFARARTVDDIDAALRMSHTPFLNTLAADDKGDALYVDASRVPALSDDGLAAWMLARRAIPALARAWSNGIVVLDASMPAFDLAGDEHGAIPIDDRTPRLKRRDWVMNANAPYQWTHRAVEMPERSPLYGDAPAPTLRTIANWDLLDTQTKLDHFEAAALLLANRSTTAERLADDVAAACKRDPDPPCQIIERWGRDFGVSSRGAALWRELLVHIAPGGRIPWAHPYDPADPTTPRGLALSAKEIRDALGLAYRDLATPKSHPDSPLGDLQTAATAHGRVGVPGGQQLDGVANIAAWDPGLNSALLPRDDGGDAKYPVDFGSSFIMAVDLTKDGPHAAVLLTYGNSSDPASPYYRDQLGELAAGRLRPARFTPQDIADDQRVYGAQPAEDLRYTEPAP
jgi:acyl-homoserine-lactone acylase